MVIVPDPSGALISTERFEKNIYNERSWKAVPLLILTAAGLDPDALTLSMYLESIIPSQPRGGVPELITENGPVVTDVIVKSLVFDVKLVAPALTDSKLSSNGHCALTPNAENIRKPTSKITSRA